MTCGRRAGCVEGQLLRRLWQLLLGSCWESAYLDLVAVLKSFYSFVTDIEVVGQSKLECLSAQVYFRLSLMIACKA
jgi:hypothetical protein